jgi:hypothetical protein
MMAKHEWTIGDVKIAVEAPDGVPVAGACVSVRPADRAQFLAAAEAVGGIAALSMPKREQLYEQSAIVCAPGEGEGETNFEACVEIQEPPRPHGFGERVLHSFFGPLAERVERERAAETDTSEDGES